MLAQLGEARKIDCSYAYSAQEGSTETCTPVSAASVKVDFWEEYFDCMCLIFPPLLEGLFHRCHLVIKSASSSQSVMIHLTAAQKKGLVHSHQHLVLNHANPESEL